MKLQIRNLGHPFQNYSLCGFQIDGSTQINRRPLSVVFVATSLAEIVGSCNNLAFLGQQILETAFSENYCRCVWSKVDGDQESSKSFRLTNKEHDALVERNAELAPLNGRLLLKCGHRLKDLDVARARTVRRFRL